MAHDVSVQRDIAADPDLVWALVSDVTRMGEWSPETTGCRWVGGASGPAVGARFRGRNQAGIRRWSTTCTVTGCEPGRLFAFDVSFGPLAVATWSYEIEPTDAGCTVGERWTDRRGVLARYGGNLLTGVADRGDHNRAGMQQTLARLAAVAEAATSAPD